MSNIPGNGNKHGSLQFALLVAATLGSLSCYAADNVVEGNAKVGGRVLPSTTCTGANTNHKYIVVGMGNSGGAPVCAGCGPDAPGGGPPLKAMSPKEGDQDFEWNEKQDPKNKFARIIVAPTGDKLPHDYHVVAAGPTWFASCDDALTWLNGGAGQGFMSKMKYVVLASIGIPLPGDYPKQNKVPKNEKVAK